MGACKKDDGATMLRLLKPFLPRLEETSSLTPPSAIEHLSANTMPMQGWFGGNLTSINALHNIIQPGTQESGQELNMVRPSPIAILDIGSNSVRLVVYEGELRAPHPIFNEKATCALGKGLAATGYLDGASVGKALNALRRFRILAQSLEVATLLVIATAALRDAANSEAFLAAAKEALGGVPVLLLSGEREAQLSALGVISGIAHADGFVGDLGGGSLELVEIAENALLDKGVSLPLGGFTLSEAAQRSPRKAVKIVRDALAKIKTLDRMAGRAFYAVGGTWRSLARLHMHQSNYPLSIMHHYSVEAAAMLEFCQRIGEAPLEAANGLAVISASRRALLPYGAVVLAEIIRRGAPARIVISALGVREGLLYERLPTNIKIQNPLIAATRAMNAQYARSPLYGDELCAFTDRLFEQVYRHHASDGTADGLVDETRDETSLRHAACYLSDLGWRAHPDYRGEHALNMIAYANFTGVDHAGRAFLALAASYRHIGLEQEIDTRMKSLVSVRTLERARVLGAVLRVAFVLTAAMPGILPRLGIEATLDRLSLRLPADLAALKNERLCNRFRELGTLLTRAAVLEIAD